MRPALNNKYINNNVLFWNDITPVSIYAITSNESKEYNLMIISKKGFRIYVSLQFINLENLC